MMEEFSFNELPSIYLIPDLARLPMRRSRGWFSSSGVTVYIHFTWIVEFSQAEEIGF